jgi:hypothetical protein
VQGSTYKRCACRDPATGRQLGGACPRLRQTGHGTWYLQLRLPDRSSPFRLGGYNTRAAAEAALTRIRSLLDSARQDAPAQTEVVRLIRATPRGGLPPQIDEVRRRLQAGVDLTERMTVADWLEYWLDEKSKKQGASTTGGKIRASTARAYEAHLRLYLIPRLGALPLDQLRPRQIAEMFEWIETSNSGRQRPVSPATMARIFATLK